MRFILIFVTYIFLAALVCKSNGQEADPEKPGVDDEKPAVVGFDYGDKSAESDETDEAKEGDAAEIKPGIEDDDKSDEEPTPTEGEAPDASDAKPEPDSVEAEAAVEKDVEAAQTVAVEGGEEKQNDDGAQAVADEAASAVEVKAAPPADGGTAPSTDDPNAWLEAHKAKRERLNKRIDALKATRKEKKKQRDRCLRGGCHESTDEQKECVKSPGCSTGKTTCGTDGRTYYTECHAKCYGSEKLHWGPCKIDKKKMHLPVGKPIELQKDELYPNLECHPSLIRNNLFGHQFGQGYIVKVMAECNKPEKHWKRFVNDFNIKRFINQGFNNVVEPSQCYEKCVLQKHGVLRPRGDGLLPEKLMFPKMFKDKDIRAKITKKIVENCKPLLDKAKGANIKQRVQCSERTELYHCVDQAMGCEGLY